MLHDIEVIIQPQLAIRRIAVSGMDNNVYLLTERSSGRQLLIDAAAEAEAIIELVAGADGDAPVPTEVVGVFTTHSHPDHIGALAAITAHFPRAETLAGAPDAQTITTATGVLIDRPLVHGERVVLGPIELEVIGLRGHTPGSIALVHAEPDQPTRIFTGDSLFPGGVGNTQGDPARFESLFTDVVERIFEAYPDDTVIHPGHGAATTLGTERPQLSQWQARGW